MSAILPILPLIAGGTAAVGQLAAGENARAASNRNAEMMEREAELARTHGAIRAQAQGRQARELLGRQRAAIGQAGIGFEGSAADVMLESATTAELDSMNAMYETELQARGMLNQAAVTRWEGKVAQRSSRLAAGVSLLSGAADYQRGVQLNRQIETARAAGRPTSLMGP